ncbi:MAG: FAD-binding oxidoreductase [Bryobacteraceae bacterium]
MRLITSLLFALASLAADLPHEARVMKVQELTHDTKLIRFKAGRDFTFKPGQFVLLQVPPAFVEEWNAKYKTSHQQVRRPYSFASSPKKLPVFDLIVKLVGPPPGKDVPPGIASTFLTSRVKPGDTLRFGAAIGSLFPGVDKGRPIVLVAGGTGVAPFVCLIEHWFETKAGNPIYLFFGVRSRRDLFLHQQFEKWARTKKGFHYIPALSNPAPEDQWTGETGFINVTLGKRLQDIRDPEVFVAGSPVMMRETVKVLQANGVPKERIHQDPIQVK